MCPRKRLDQPTDAGFMAMMSAAGGPYRIRTPFLKDGMTGKQTLDGHVINAKGYHESMSLTKLALASFVLSTQLAVFDLSEE